MRSMTVPGILLLAPLLALLLGCATLGPAADPQAERELLMQRSRAWSDLAAMGDLEAALDVWAEDAVMLPPGGRALHGRPAIRAYLEAAFQTPGFQIAWEPMEAFVSESGELGYLVERIVTVGRDEAGELVTTHGKAVTVWRKGADGVWRNVADIWNEGPRPTP